MDAAAYIHSAWCVCEWEGARLLADKEAGAVVMAIISIASQIYGEHKREQGDDQHCERR